MTPDVRARVRAAVRANGDDLLRYFERRVGSRDDAADLLGETMLQVWRRAESMPGESERQRMWLYTVAAHVLANQRRSSRRRAALTERLRHGLAEEPSPPDHTASIAVRDAVLGLRQTQRELVMLIHWDGFSIVEAAELLGLNPSTARGRYSAARDALRAALSEPADVRV